ncbi:MAG: helix-turn-helix domain-containing protein [Desulfovibrionaceae bacterium]|nr:helix-turn-helix domain-containing protein [Desulfovibrionaceae bacterium]
MKLLEMGVLLKRERERLGLSIKQVTDETKISRRIVTALEEGDREHLPHPVYVKGFVKNYARLLGLDPEQMAKVVEREFALQDDEDEEFVQAPEQIGPADVPKAGSRLSLKGPSWASLLLIGLFVLVLAAMVMYMNKAWIFKDFRFSMSKAAVAVEAEGPRAEEAVKATEPETEQAVKALENELLKAEPAGTLPAGVHGPGPAGEPEPVQVSEALPREAAEQAPEGPGIVQGPEAVDREQAAAEPPVPVADRTEAGPAPAGPEPRAVEAVDQEGAVAPAIEPPAAAGDRIQVLKIRAKKDAMCWLGVSADNGEVREYILRDGQSASFKFEKSLKVKFGNIQAVDLVLNGSDYALGPGLGPVKTLVFPVP